VHSLNIAFENSQATQTTASSPPAVLRVRPESTTNLPWTSSTRLGLWVFADIGTVVCISSSVAPATPLPRRKPSKIARFVPAMGSALRAAALLVDE